MKHLTIYEQYDEHKIPIGDYVVCHINSFGGQHEELNKFFKINIGKLIKINYDTVSNPLKIEFDKMTPLGIPNETSNVIWLYRADIIYHASNKEDLEIYVQTNKYNL